MRLKKWPTGTLIFAGLAAIAYYKYSRMNEKQKNRLINKLRKMGRKIYDCYVPVGLKNLPTKSENVFWDEDFGEHSDYSF